MLYPAMGYTWLASGMIMMSSSAFVIFKIYKGSKSQFALILMAFTFIDGVQNLTSFFIDLYRHPV